MSTYLVALFLSHLVLQAADNLASLQQEVNVVVPLYVLFESLTAQGKGAKEIVLAAITNAKASADAAEVKCPRLVPMLRR